MDLLEQAQQLTAEVVKARTDVGVLYALTRQVHYLPEEIEYCDDNGQSITAGEKESAVNALQQEIRSRIEDITGIQNKVRSKFWALRNSGRDIAVQESQSEETDGIHQLLTNSEIAAFNKAFGVESRREAVYLKMPTPMQGGYQREMAAQAIGSMTDELLSRQAQSGSVVIDPHVLRGLVTHGLMESNLTVKSDAVMLALLAERVQFIVGDEFFAQAAIESWGQNCLNLAEVMAASHDAEMPSRFQGNQRVALERQAQFSASALYPRLTDSDIALVNSVLGLRLEPQGQAANNEQYALMKQGTLAALLNHAKALGMADSRGYLRTNKPLPNYKAVLKETEKLWCIAGAFTPAVDVKVAVARVGIGGGATGGHDIPIERVTGYGGVSGGTERAANPADDQRRRRGPPPSCPR